MRGATTCSMSLCVNADISIHAPLCGERPCTGRDVLLPDEFQSTLPYAGSDHNNDDLAARQGNFNPRSPMRGATGRSRDATQRNKFQSTLPYAGSDDIALFFGRQLAISIHAPLCGERPMTFFDCSVILSFQSTLPYAGSDRTLI